MNSQPIFPFLLLLFIFSCKERKDDSTFDPSAVLKTTDLTKGYNSAISDTSMDRISDMTSLALGIDTITSGYNVLQIRIWRGEGIEYKSSVLILKRDQKKWTGQKISYDERNAKDGYATNIKLAEAHPKNGWEKLLNTLAGDGIFTLRDWGEIKGYDLSTDCDGFGVEIAADQYYRAYNYPCHDEHREVKDVQQFSKIVKFLNKEFDMKWPE